MTDIFVEFEWLSLCQRLEAVGDHVAQTDSEKERMRKESRSFAEQEAPRSYTDLLERVRRAAKISIRWHDEAEVRAHVDEMIDEAGEESFPASDPPSFTGARI